MSVLILLLAVTGVALGQKPSSSLCPQSKGTVYMGDSVQCDKYYVCEDGVLTTEELCPDGLVFDLSGKYDLCDLPFDIDCGDRKVLQPASEPSEYCHRLYGSYPVQDPNNCHEYYECVEGVPHKRTCTTGTVFDPLTGGCDWAYKVKRNCTTRPRLGDFFCPDVQFEDQYGQVITHPKYPHADCTLFYVCLNGFEPRIGTCREGLAFSDVTHECEDPLFVPGCEHLAEDVEEEEESIKGSRSRLVKQN